MRKHGDKMRVAYFGPWIGEFGWELMAWQAWCRQESRKYDKSYACSFPDMEPLYADFAEFIPHNHPGRALNWTDLDAIEYQIPDDVTEHIKPVKTYRLGGEFVKFGHNYGKGYNLLMHARGVSRGSSKNYPAECWKEIADHFEDVACIGSYDDQYIEGTIDLRGTILKSLMNIISGARLVVGQSSGVMHLASLCGTPHIVWGDSRTYFGETLLRRYEETWNPLWTSVEFIFDDDWQPKPAYIIEAIEGWLEMPKQQVDIDVGQLMADNLKSAMESDKWLITVSYKRDDGKLQHTYELKSGYDKRDVLPSLGKLRDMLIREEQLDAITPGETEEETGWH